MLPFRFTAQVSLDDAAKLAKALGFRYEVLPIADAVNGFEKILSEPFAGLPRDITEENLQARTRGTLLMAISNKTGAMVVTTGNKSEMSVGYATIYGDMNGGFNPIKDIYKTEVFRLSSLRNEWKPDGALGPSGEVIPVNIITRPPTAELRENQTDQDSLPPYEMLDGILERLVEREEPLATIIAAGFPADVVTRIDRLLNIAEYKRRQAAPGVKVTEKNFGRDRRYPITNRFRDNGKALPAPDEKLVVARRPRLGGSIRGVRRGFERGAGARALLLRRNEGRADRADPFLVGGSQRSSRPGRSLQAAAAAVPAGAAPFLAAAALRPSAARAAAYVFALSSVTMMSPCSTPALSSTDFSASDQVWPAALQAQDGLNSVRNLNAFGSDE